MQFVIIRGLRYAYSQVGSGAPLLLLHGFSGSTQNWADHQSAFADHYSVIMLDLPGHGATDAPDDPARYSMEQTTRDLALFIEQVAGKPVHLLGYSMGGRIALSFTLTHPQWVRSLLLESAGPGIANADERTARAERDNALADWIEQHGVTAFVDRWEALPLFATQRALPADQRDRLRQQRLTNRAVGLANSLRGIGTGVQPSNWNKLHHITAPTLLLAGELDPKFVTIARQMAPNLPNADLHMIPAAGHTIHLERPAAFQQVVRAFLKRRRD